MRIGPLVVGVVALAIGLVGWYVYGAYVDGHVADVSLVTNDQGDNSDMSSVLYYHHAGAKHEVESHRVAPIQAAIIDCLGQIFDRPRLYVDSDRVNSEVLSEEAWELLYDGAVSVDLGGYGRGDVSRVVVPLAGYFAPDGQGTQLTVLTQSDATSDAWDIWLCYVPGETVWRDLQP